jgi:hypothetical protein
MNLAGQGDLLECGFHQLYLLLTMWSVNQLYLRKFGCQRILPPNVAVRWK